MAAAEDQEALYLTEQSLRNQFLAIMAQTVSNFMSLAVLWATWQKEHGSLSACDQGCLDTLPRMTMGISILTTAYYLYTSFVREEEAPTANTSLLLAANLLGAAATALRADVLFSESAEQPGTTLEAIDLSSGEI